MDNSEITDKCFTMGSLYKYAKTPSEIKFFNEIELFDKTRSFTLYSNTSVSYTHLTLPTILLV